MNSCPNISAITLERFLSDHRPILMRESHYDYGHVPSRFFHYWFEIKGFDKFVEDSWKEAVVVEPNAMTKLMKKLKHLKEKIRLWNKGNTMSSQKRTLKSDLADLDLIIDKGCDDVEIVNKRANVVRSLQELKNLQSLEAAQKSKIKWTIEGDENSKSLSFIYWNILESDVVDAVTSFFHHAWIRFPLLNLGEEWRKISLILCRTMSGGTSLVNIRDSGFGPCQSSEISHRSPQLEN
ncbi:hypothetical protein Tco_0352894 [Tanacetum coccineum]